MVEEATVEIWEGAVVRVETAEGEEGEDADGFLALSFASLVLIVAVMIFRHNHCLNARMSA